MQRKYSKLDRELKRQAKIRAKKEVQQEINHINKKRRQEVNKANKEIKELKNLIIQKDKQIQEKTTQLNQLLSQKKAAKDAVSEERQRILRIYRLHGYTSTLTSWCEQYIRNCNKVIGLPRTPNPNSDKKNQVRSISEDGQYLNYLGNAIDPFLSNPSLLEIVKQLKY